MDQYRILIGGIGDDAHSVGISFLQLGFKEAGFYVKSLGIRNSLDSFFKHLPDFDIILISNKNGHAELYLQEFPKLLSNYILRDDSKKLWYLGGSLSVSESDFKIKKRFINMGFTNVYPKPIDFLQILEDINKNIIKYNIPKRSNYTFNKQYNSYPKINYDLIIDRKLTEEELTAQRVEVLKEYETGKDLLFNEVAHKSHCITLDALLWNRKVRGGAPLYQPRTGVADIELQIDLLRFLKEAGSDVSSVQLDSASRAKLYDTAKLGLETSKIRKNSVLNGFPIPVYGVKEVQRLVYALNNPFQLRAGGPDHRFTYEIALNAGISGFEGGFICYLLPYDKLTSPLESLRNWQYVDRLCSSYESKNGISINREYFGVLTATLIEPSLAIVVNIIQAILSAQQGISSITVGYAEQGNRIQDIAAIQTIEEQVNRYLRRYKYFNCRVTTVFHQFMAAFPEDYKKAEELILNSSITANLAGATKVMVKTPVEAIKIPTKYDNAKALRICKQGASLAHHFKVDTRKLEVEKRILRMEVNQMMECIIELGNGSIAKGAIKAIENGIIDIPWSPSIYNMNKVTSVRDVDGAIRFYDFGNMPFSQEVKSFHLDKVNIRKDMERDPSIFSLIEKDLTRIWKNDYKTWPLDNSYIN
jgi:methylaspartate mutase epsilon subunit